MRKYFFLSLLAITEISGSFANPQIEQAWNSIELAQKTLSGIESTEARSANVLLDKAIALIRENQMQEYKTKIGTIKTNCTRAENKAASEDYNSAVSLLFEANAMIDEIEPLAEKLGRKREFDEIRGISEDFLAAYISLQRPEYTGDISKASKVLGCCSFSCPCSCSCSTSASPQVFFPPVSYEKSEFASMAICGAVFQLMQDTSMRKTFLGMMMPIISQSPDFGKKFTEEDIVKELEKMAVHQ